MTITGRVKNGVIVPDEPVNLPEGAEVEITTRQSRARALAGSLAKYAEGKDIPSKNQMRDCLIKGLNRGR